MQQPQEFIPVTIDKSHITTRGERLYAESIEFVRELVSNAYDADAGLVEIMMTDDAIEIRENGSGMDIEGLKQYFNIGSQQKLPHPYLLDSAGIVSACSALVNLPVFRPANVSR